MNQPKVTLVGAGPGDPTLITVKGANALTQADVVLYDALVDTTLLDYCATSTITQYVGKRARSSSHSQEEINELLVTMAQTHGHVVRLKGGDPFVFGRGFEELKYVLQHDIVCEVIPGVSSATALPSMAGFPLTHRSISGNFHVCSATLSKGVLNPSIKELVHEPGTKVILMGLGKLQAIVDTYQEVDRGDESIAIIENGSKLNQRIVVGTINDIVSKSKKEQLTTPSTILIGPTIQMRLTL